MEVVEGHRRKPLRAPNLRYVVTFRVHQTFVGHSLAINAAKRMIAAVRHTHYDVPFAANAEIDVANCQARSITAPPMPQVLRLRPGFEQQIGATSEDASESDLAVGRVTVTSALPFTSMFFCLLGF
jgi:hypothetical protein